MATEKASGVPPDLRQFRIERRPNGIVHLVFDAPGRTMNVLSNEAIHELGAFAKWLAGSDVSGVVLCSGKTAFCAGADLNELAVAYGMIGATAAASRFNAAYDHFFQLSAAIRAIETCGKPVAAAIGGLALGGGCELAMGAHFRVLADTPSASLGLPESRVGLLPGGGGTQRLPRLIGLEAALPILLDGERLAGAAARDAGLVHAVVAPGSEISVAEEWLNSSPVAQQPWDRPSWVPPAPGALSASIGAARAEVLGKTLGHYPAPLAILDCLQFGLPQCFDAAIRSEMAIFAHLIQRAEPRNMIQSLFFGRSDYERGIKRSEVPPFVGKVVSQVQAILMAHKDHAASLAAAGFENPEKDKATPVRRRVEAGYWIDEGAEDPHRHMAQIVLGEISAAVAPMAPRLSTNEQRLADFAAIQEAGYPAYLGGPFAFIAGRSQTGAGSATWRQQPGPR